MTQLVPYAFQNATGTLPLSQLDADLNYVSGKWVSVQDQAFGAIGNNIADDTTAIQAAINYIQSLGGGTVFFPACTGYKVTATLTVTHSSVALVGSSFSGCAIVASGNFGDAVYIHPTSGNLQNICVQNLQIYTTNDTTSGAGLRLEKCTFSQFSNLRISNRVGGLLVDSCSHCYFSNVDTTMGEFWVAQKSGSYLVKVNAAAGGPSAELFFSNCDWVGNTPVTSYLQDAVVAEACDGLFLSNVHCGFCYGVGLAIRPTADSGLVGVYGSNVFVDGTGSYGLYVKEFSATVSASCVAYISGFTAYQCGEGVRVDHRKGAVGLSSVVASLMQTHGLNFLRGVNSSISNVQISDVNASATTGYGINVGATQNGLDISQLFVEKITYTPTAGVFLTAGASNIAVKGARFSQCTADITDNATATSKLFANIISDVAFGGGATVVTAASTINLPSAYSMLLLTGPTAVNNVDASSSWKGREVVIVANGVVTVNNGGNLFLTANWTPGVAGKTLCLICDGTTWYEKSRT